MHFYYGDHYCAHQIDVTYRLTRSCRAKIDVHPDQLGLNLVIRVIYDYDLSNERTLELSSSSSSPSTTLRPSKKMFKISIKKQKSIRDLLVSGGDSKDDRGLVALIYVRLQQITRRDDAPIVRAAVHPHEG